MDLTLRIAFATVVGAVVAVGACGGNVVVDGQSTSAGTGGGSVAITGFGGNVTSSTVTGFGGNVTSSTVTGFGGDVTSSTVTGFGGDVTSSTVTGFGGDMTSSTSGFGGTGGGGGPGMACNDSTDLTITDDLTLWQFIFQCAEENLNNPGGDTMCLESQLGLTAPCVQCAVDYTTCGEQFCEGPCGNGPDDLGCMSCRNKACGALFSSCAGVPSPGSMTCATLLMSGWQRGLTGVGFLTAQAGMAYQYLDSCACAQSVPDAGCSTDCDAALSNGPPDFCNGAAPSVTCNQCLATACAGVIFTCQQN
jgi:hypothetical protein